MNDTSGERIIGEKSEKRLPNANEQKSNFKSLVGDAKL